MLLMYLPVFYLPVLKCTYRIWNKADLFGKYLVHLFLLFSFLVSLRDSVGTESGYVSTGGYLPYLGIPWASSLINGGYPN